MKDTITYVAMDTHKKQHKVALHYPCQEEVLEFTVKNTVRDIKRMINKVAKRAPGKVEFCYEAGVCGFTLKRRIEQFGCRCSVIAPSLVPAKPGQRVKTDRRDAKKLLAMLKAGLLTEVHAPNQHQEAARELTRLRETAADNLKRIRHQLLKFLTRHGYVYTQGRHWTQKHITWLRTIEFTESMLTNVFENYLNEMIYCMGRLEKLDKEVELLANSQEYKDVVGLLRCFHGIDTLTATTILTEIFEFGRFESPRHLMSYLGLTPSEDSSGDKQKKGPITKTGNKRIRRLLNEASWHYRHRYVPSAVLRKRRKGQPQWAIEIADAAGRRLSKRHRHLINNGKMPCKANIAVARELAGFIWFVVTQYRARQSIKNVA
ncbi:MAG TPA: IS110 family transposase [Sedimentisphaerales bacterium]|nr:IS110 family transposase [Sedimentisphaerales bacterium]